MVRASMLLKTKGLCLQSRPFVVVWWTSWRAVAFAKEGRSRHTRVLNEEPRVELHPSFLDLSDVDALRALSEDVGFEDIDPSQARVNGGEELVSLNLSDPEVSEDTDDAVQFAGRAAVVRLESSVAQWAAMHNTVVPPPIITRWEPWSLTSKLNRSGVLHLDPRRNLWRSRTVLVYLSGVGSADDGFTVFPCLETDDMEAREVSRRAKLCSRAFRHLKLAQDTLLRTRDNGLLLAPDQQFNFLKQHPELAALAPEDPDAGGRRPVDWRWLPEHDSVATNAPTPQQLDALHALAEAMCRGHAPGLRVAPVAGTALFLEVAEMPERVTNIGMVPDWRLWHAGCSARDAHRWTAQFFLEHQRNKSERSNLSITQCASGTCSVANDGDAKS
eukprot:TRINITY_DN69730_c0_g1_i1.p1 TRINITY_DN69730_c0_g1~~TRINITY_DN69730_c0_g1_i1.p1  ORF type:complete len:387 (-),score=56.45 TRINITY_DN69730_c0_g1_i1:74-1234(-)